MEYNNERKLKSWRRQKEHCRKNTQLNTTQSAETTKLLRMCHLL